MLYRITIHTGEVTAYTLPTVGLKGHEQLSTSKYSLPTVLPLSLGLSSPRTTVALSSYRRLLSYTSFMLHYSVEQEGKCSLASHLRRIANQRSQNARSCTTVQLPSSMTEHAFRVIDYAVFLKPSRDALESLITEAFFGHSTMRSIEIIALNASSLESSIYSYQNILIAADNELLRF